MYSGIVSRFLTLLLRPVERERGRGGRMNKLPESRNVWKATPSLENIKYTRMRHLKKFKISHQRCPARMFPRASLCRSTGLFLLVH